VLSETWTWVFRLLSFGCRGGFGAGLGQAWVLRRRNPGASDWSAFSFLCLPSWTLCLSQRRLLVCLLDATIALAVSYWFVLVFLALE
jgi:hypothetical protein